MQKNIKEQRFTLNTDIGPVIFTHNENRILKIEMSGKEPMWANPSIADASKCSIRKEASCSLEKQIVEQVRNYFLASNFRFSLPLQHTGTDFQQRVCQALQAIPAGQVKTYGELANQLQSSARAVGGACRRNPFPLIVPCHRVVAKTHIGGFAGDTDGFMLDKKIQLLKHENYLLS